MSKATIKVKDTQGRIVKEYDMELVESETIQEFYEEARRVWAEHHVEFITDRYILSRDFTYEQEMIMLAEEEQYKQFLTLAEAW